VSLWSVLAGAAPRYLALRRSQYWDEATLSRYQHDALSETLAAAAKIPFYAEVFGTSAPRIEDFGKLPRLRRSDIRALNQSVRSRPQTAEFTSGRSSGSSGMPAEFLFDRSHQIGRFATRARYLLENGWNPARRNVWLLFHGPYMEQGDAALVKSRAVLRTRFIHPTTDFEDLAHQICAIDPLHFFAYPEYLTEVLNVLEREGRSLPSLKKIFTGSEVLEDSVRQRVRNLLGVEIADGYGTTEGFIGWQCPTGSYHVNAEHMMLEVLDEQGHPVGPGEMGRVVVTTLENRLMPLVRYEIGDFTTASRGPCRCGRTLPTFERVIGRSLNLFRLADGRLLSPWTFVEVLRDSRLFRQFQIIQEALDRYTLNFAVDTPLTPEAREHFRAAFSKLVGSDITLSFEQFAEIPRTSGRKFMLAISRLAQSS
jgi:phenylacetate-CoA ligase